MATHEDAHPDVFALDEAINSTGYSAAVLRDGESLSLIERTNDPRVIDMYIDCDEGTRCAEVAVLTRHGSGKFSMEIIGDAGEYTGNVYGPREPLDVAAELESVIPEIDR